MLEEVKIEISSELLKLAKENNIRLKDALAVGITQRADVSIERHLLLKELEHHTKARDSILRRLDETSQLDDSNYINLVNPIIKTIVIKAERSIPEGASVNEWIHTELQDHQIARFIRAQKIDITMDKVWEYLDEYYPYTPDEEARPIIAPELELRNAVQIIVNDFEKNKIAYLKKHNWHSIHDITEEHIEIKTRQYKVNPSDILAELSKLKI